ncbi:PREDICTED: uncharacterized protein LOC104699428 [Camelina sativa]|uniref:Uncharacterized protein LOC104699428 n=1 Tax=Camelina sativa TaxID=90675 RepID=A0ABM0SLK7_CAMSA|nr:PREDICTED: uncharacterized protein LOC104699428 [Camelina sativa]
MSELATGTRPKDMDKSVSIQCPQLTSTNYTVWSMKMKVILRIQKVWKTIEPGSTDRDKNDVATTLLFQSIPESLILQVGDLATPKDIWDSIKSRNMGADRVKEARIQTLMSDFEKLRMADSDRFDVFAGKLSEIATQATSLGQTIDEPRMVKKMLNSVPRNKFIHLVASLEQVLDLNTTSFQDIVGRLKAFEERIQGEDKQEDTQGKLLFTGSDYQTQTNYTQSFNNFRGRGRGRGCRGYRGRGRGRYNGQDQTEFHTNQNQTQEKKEKVITYKLMPKNYNKEEGMWNIRGKVKFGDGSCVEIVGKGSILFESKNGEQILVFDIYYIPDLKSNILSFGQATEVGCDVRKRRDYLMVHDPRERLLEDRLRCYHVLMTTPGSGTLGLDTSVSKRSKQYSTGVPKNCPVSSTKPLELLHADMCGPISPATLANNRYIFVIIDDFSRYMWSILIKEKSEAFGSFKGFKSVVEKDIGSVIKTLRTDRGGEFTSREFNEFCEFVGITRHLTAPYTPQQNGVVERRNRTLMEMTRSLLKGMEVPNY